MVDHDAVVMRANVCHCMLRVLDTVMCCLNVCHCMLRVLDTVWFMTPTVICMGGANVLLCTLALGFVRYVRLRVAISMIDGLFIVI